MSFDALRLLMAFGKDYESVMSLIEEARQLAANLSRGTPYIYILRLRSGALYVGCSNDVETRFVEHCAGTASRTTALDPPASVLFLEPQPDFTAARRREAQIRRWSRCKKEALIAGDVDRLRGLSRSRV